jgi:glycine betaine catabolism B
MIHLIDSALNRITMYRLALYYVAGLLFVALGFGFFGLVPNDPTSLTFSAGVILGVCWVANRLLATLLRVPANAESVYITAFILALILPPTTAANLPGVAGLVLASFAAIASKFACDSP